MKCKYLWIQMRQTHLHAYRRDLHPFKHPEQGARTKLTHAHIHCTCPHNGGTPSTSSLTHTPTHSVHVLHVPGVQGTNTLAHTLLDDRVHCITPSVVSTYIEHVPCAYHKHQRDNGSITYRVNKHCKEKMHYASVCLQ